MNDLAPQYDPRPLESPLYQQWEAAGWFRPSGPGDPYVIMIPPPNVTAHLHMGHGLNNTIQDALIRFERMRGRDTLWLPGTDHAGIATQNVVERLLATEGHTRFDIGRDAFEKRVRSHVGETGTAIIQQLKAIGASADWSRTYFTLDAGLSRAVREVFVRLHERGLIYRGKYIINWCPRCLTALSNEEAEKEEVDGSLWHIRYPLTDGGHLVVATTRPETMLGDTGVAVHPEDARYTDLVGRAVMLPLTNRQIPIVADDTIDQAFGTGCVKMTPAHDPLDFEIAQRHGLPILDILSPEARMTDEVPSAFRGLDRFEARRAVVQALTDAGLIEKVEPHRHAVGHCYRCHTIVEPRLSNQWFVRMAPLAEPALAAYRDGRLTFIPPRRGEEYAQWMEGIRDWCISRQLWWGHRIPVFYCDAPGCGKVSASRDDITSCPNCGGAVRQDEDVLDTWFSSWLVPFSSLGWPDATPDLQRYYPGNTLVTAPEILFFWVARMIMAGIEFMGELPFTTVYLHGTVRDTQHRKMSKSLGNGIDPLEVVDRFGADALRYTVLAGTAVGTDLILDPQDLDLSFAAGRNFANKLWNAGRFLLGHLDAAPRPLVGPEPTAIAPEELQLADRWILARCDEMVREATSAFERFRLNDAAASVYRFIWSDLADWYIEQIKPRLYGDQPGGDVARAVGAQTFDVALRVLHPIMPFITDVLWKRFPGRHPDASLMTAAWPAPDDRAQHPTAVEDFRLVQDVVSAVRSIRAEYGIPLGKAVPATVASDRQAVRDLIQAEQSTIRRLARVEPLGWSDQDVGDKAAGTSVLPDGTAVLVPLGDLIDIGRECERLGSEADRLTGLVRAQETKLSNDAFVTRAPAEIVARERAKLAGWQEQVALLRQKQERLDCAS